jgi:uncharacterized protein YkwD
MILDGTARAARAGEPGTDDDLALAILAEINSFRAGQGLRPLSPSRQLERAAQAHALSMGRLGYFSHSSANGSGASSRIASFYPVAGAIRWRVGEVMVWQSGSLSALEALAMWLASPPHRSELIETRWRDIGVGVVRKRNAEGVYGGHDVTIAVVDFGLRRRSAN